MDVKIDKSTMEDYHKWIALACEVEDLFGPMSEDSEFRHALFLSISAGNAFCIRECDGLCTETLAGGIIISREFNELVWLAVSESCRGRGYGRALVQFALEKLNTRKAVTVQTFDKSVDEGRAARHLYQYFGFMDHRSAEVNPAGIPTVIMKRK